MPKVKPTWVCQSCERQFTTKYSLMRHFKRFPQHSPPHLSPTDGEIKPITVQINDNVRTVTGIPIQLAPGSASSHGHGTRFRQHKHQEISEEEDAVMVESSTSKKNSQQQPMNHSTGHSGRRYSLHNVSDIETSPSSSEFDSPAANDTSTEEMSNDEAPSTKKNQHYPFLPPFLEDEQILNIATPQQPLQQTVHSPLPPSGALSPAPPSADPNRLLSSPLAAHYSWVFAKDTTAPEPGQAFLSPLAPACTSTNFRQVFQEEEEKLKRLAASANKHVRSPVELAALDKSLLLGDEEATSPFTFMEKTSSHEPIIPVAATALDFLSPPYQSAREVNMDDLDLGRFYAPMV
ncbi:expressed unknown protein [Seminavis robusta]|uniref:C2H2-type domain-containing protein n=1 Tax=Seminavis robusta TaxID=568900 RepID=A0A9N8HP80_9STRA|nr:expressed unknown protein [Seminavis robusta]|eukprot:Sro1298_g260570.1 n/a (348) ;mRNA; r:3893-4936